MRILVATMLFPNRAQPHHGVFVKERLRHFRERHGAAVTVVAPTVWTPPFRTSARWEAYRAVPRAEVVDGFEVVHPRYPNPPGAGDRWRARLMAAGIRRTLRDVARRFGPTVLDAHYAYPDGVAVARLRPGLERALGRRLPLVVTCRGTDLNLLPEQPAVRAQVEALMREADHVICVADALRERALELGAPPERTTTLRNGVDVDRFTPGDRAAARRALDLQEDGTVVVAVGHLIERKGQHLLLEAFARGPADRRLVLVGDGEARGALTAQAARLGVADRVVFTGAVPPERLPELYRAADVSVLASSREGWPNVVLESLACGTPVIATAIWGTPEILAGCAAGRLVPPTADGLAEGLADLRSLDPAAARPWAERFTWDETADGMAAIFEEVAR